MNRIVTFCAAGLSALVLTGSTAMAQPYGYGAPVYDEAPYAMPAPYQGGPTYGGPVYYRGIPDASYGGGHYSAHREVYIGPYGDTYRRCRPHHACYNYDN